MWQDTSKHTYIQTPTYTRAETHKSTNTDAHTHTHAQSHIQLIELNTRFQFT